MSDPGLDTPHHIHAFRSVPPGCRDPAFARHTHPFHEIVTLCRGTAVQLLGPQSFPLTPGELFLLPAGSWHIAGSQQTPCSCIVLNFYDGSFGDVQPGDREARRIVEALTRRSFAGKPRLDVTATTRRQILARLDAMAHAGEHRQELGRQCAIKADLLAILALLAADSRLRLADEVRDHRDPDVERIGRVTVFIRERLSESLPVARLAEVAGLSASHFHTVFKRRTGMTVLGYVTRVRVQAAAELLRTSPLPVKDVARQCGFPCLSHFHAVFRRHTGLPPGQFVAAHATGGAPRK